MIATIAEKVEGGERLTPAEAEALFRHPDLTELGLLAGLARRRWHPDPVVTYNVGRNVNYTNVCWVRCDFCAFYRPPGDGEGYVLPQEAIFAKLDELVAVGGSLPKSCELLMQGGLNPRLRLEWYEELLRALRDRYPMIHLHSLSATEILYIAHLSRLSLEETIRRLRAAGLDSIPGAGAEILSDEVRDRIGFRKDRVDEWLEVHRTAHRLGMPTTATMMYGHVESVAQRVEHLTRVRDLQDETGGFTAFIAWSFQPENTALAATPDRWQGRRATGFDHLRTVAVARLFLDNVPNLQASWVTQGPKIAQISLHYGVNDFGSTMLEENVVSAAGTAHTGEMNLAEMRRLIAEAGFEPRRRDTLYRAVPEPAAAVA
ncbi:MAG: cyclic dehypoxanthinyl futalosine synthase [Candidatus Latescibacterota bacterium]|jgi:cyclic dehypoxanthinyl futalosine synthase